LGQQAGRAECVLPRLVRCVTMDETSPGFVHPAATGLEQRLARLGPNQRTLLERRLRDEPCSGHHLVARTLACLGVTHVYGVPGQPVYDTFGACARQGLRLIGTHHQQPAALMAAAHNYFAGRQAATTIVSAGAPVANALSAVVVAGDNCWPLVVLAGAAPRRAADAGYFMALDAGELYRPVIKWATRVRETGEIPTGIAKAFELAMSGRPGPVLVELPEDVLSGLSLHGELPTPASIRPEAPEPDQAALQQAAGALIAARRPLLIIGKGMRWGSPFAELRELVDSLSIPFITSPIGRGAIPDGHPLCMNTASWAAQSQADLVLLLGARLNWVFRYGRQIAPEATVIQVDVEASEFGRTRKLTLGVHADGGGFLRALLTEIGAAQRTKAQTCRDQRWIGALRELRALAEGRRESLAGGASPHVSPLRLAAEMRDALPADAITIFDGNLTMAACERMIPAAVPASRLTPGTSGCLGGGIPYAIAAKLAHPKRPAVAICGDFAFGLSLMELETAARHNVEIVIVVANNDGNGGSLRQRMHMRDSSADPVTMFQSRLRYDRTAETLGVYAEHVENAGDIGPALTRAIASRRPACINVAVDPDAPFPLD
jgi:thiamine pyrophosphate-dependent acetolactate synthase large subunit-like protein